MHGDGVQGWERAGFLNKNHSLEDEKEEKDEKEETKMGGVLWVGGGGLSFASVRSTGMVVSLHSLYET